MKAMMSWCSMKRNGSWVGKTSLAQRELVQLPLLSFPCVSEQGSALCKRANKAANDADAVELECGSSGRAGEWSPLGLRSMF